MGLLKTGLVLAAGTAAGAIVVIGLSLKNALLLLRRP